MKYYVCPQIGSGTQDDPYRADVPKGVGWVGKPGNGAFLIVTHQELPTATGRQQRFKTADLKAAAQERNLRYEEVEKWHVG